MFYVKHLGHPHATPEYDEHGEPVDYPGEEWDDYGYSIYDEETPIID